MNLFERLAEVTREPLSDEGKKTVDDVLSFLSECYGYLQASEESTMSRNNAENLASELVQMIEASKEEE